ncbi:UvrD-helicase domain-containing protein [Microbulbifer yueqingensis]|uniref:DNA 3'-5' helicase n=1 Tax=Microbulbifer yueqingensis TaxID=658219 RepID=A0A1G8ZHV7_9GAMM|nr:UvrD-helicase domain-containing protein [Microbulbifer yueqingensis]SDK14712.1 ATP-dependent exoDNAse (exonuclease V) beta subunit (contains helicase and exonuclease domains) [Microbulbifer yueqingensis]
MNEFVSTPEAGSRPAVSQPADADARAAALDIGRSFAVSAPAGSGKTGLLTQRVLKLLAHCRQPEEVLAITFTRKAAGEMRERLLKALLQARDRPRPQNPHEAVTWDLARQLLEQDRRHNWQLLQAPQRLRFQTIDGLCRSLASQLPIDSGLGAPGEPLEEPQLAFRMAVSRLLDDLASENPPPSLLRLLLHLDNDLGQLEKLLLMLLEKREQWLGQLLDIGQGDRDDAREYFHFVVDELIRERLQQLHAALGSATGELLELADYAGSNLAKDDPAHALCNCAGIVSVPPTEISGLPTWLALTELLVTGKGEWRKGGGLNKKLGFVSPDKKDPDYDRARSYKARMKDLLAELAGEDQLLAAVNEVRRLPAALPRDQWQLLEAMAEVLPQLVAQLKLVFQQLGATDYTEVAQAALVALGDTEAPTDLALKLDLQVQHILVDEFQDTSQMQLRLLEKLTAGWQPGDGRTLFIVGDGMQSCYGFRNANVGIFLQARARGIGEVGLVPLDLQVNFRSDNAVVAWVNETFRRAFPAQDNIGRGAVRYLDSIAFRDDSWPASAVQFHGCIDDPERVAEAARVAALVKELRTNDPGGRIAILVRKKKHLDQILPALSESGVAYQAPELAPLASKMVVLDLLSLTRALLDPSDRLSWLAVLRAPWCGLDWADLLAVANWGNENRSASDASARPLLQAIEHLQEIGQISDEGRERLGKAGRLLLGAWQERGRKPLRLWIEGLWLALGGPACVARPADLDNVEDFFRLLEKHDQGGTIGDWQQFQLALEKLFARPGPDAGVQVMTIHKSKGLEFEHVLIPGLDQGGKPGGDQLLRWSEWLNSEGESRFLLAPKSPRGEREPLFDYLKYDNSERERLEGTRLLYVGCTRAIRSLHLLACVEREEKKPGFKSPGSAALLAGIWPSLSESSDWCHWLEPRAESVGDEAGRAEKRDYFLRLPGDWQAPAIPVMEWLAPYRMADYQPRETAEPNIPELGQVTRRWLRHAGTVAHETLATIAESGIEHWDDARVLEQRPLWTLRLRQLGLVGQGLAKATDKVEQAIRKALACPSGRWLLDNRHRDSACELEIHSGQGQLRRYIIDRTFVDDGGLRWIVDYKTTEPGEGEDPEAFIAAQVERYRPQLEGYRRLFYDRGERNIRCALYLPLLQHLEKF